MLELGAIDLCIWPVCYVFVIAMKIDLLHSSLGRSNDDTFNAFRSYLSLQGMFGMHLFRRARR